MRKLLIKGTPKEKEDGAILEVGGIKFYSEPYLNDQQRIEIHHILSNLDKKSYEQFKAVITLVQNSLSYNALLAHSHLAEFYAYKLIFLFRNIDAVESYLGRVNKMGLKKEKYIQYIDLMLPRNLADKRIKHLHQILNKKDIKDNPNIMKNIINYIDDFIEFSENNNDLGKIKKNRLENTYKSRNFKQIFLEFLAKVQYPSSTKATLNDALVFSRHDMLEKHFLEWLELKESAGDSDLILPPETLFVNGGAIEQEWQLVSLHCKDPRQAVLGQITDCCQSLNGNAAHVYEDTRLESIGIVVLVKGKNQVDEDFHLSSSCKDDDIIGFMRLCVSEDGKNLIIDATAIKPIYLNSERQLKKIIQMMIKFSDNFLEKNPQFEAVWFGYNRGASSVKIKKYFLRTGEGADSIALPKGMEKYETGAKALISNREENLLTTLIKSPQLMSRLQKEDLAPYANEDVLKLAFAFGSIEDITHLISLINPEPEVILKLSFSFGSVVWIEHLMSSRNEKERQEINFFKLACDGINFDVIKFLIKGSKYCSINSEMRKDPNPLRSILDMRLIEEDRIKLLKYLFDESDRETKISLTGMDSPDGGRGFLTYLSANSFESEILFILAQLSEGGVNFNQILMEDFDGEALKLIICQNKVQVLSYLFSTLDQNEANSFFDISQRNVSIPLLHYFQNIETFELVFNTMEEDAKRRFLLAHVVYYDHSCQIKSNNLLWFCGDIGKFLYFIEQSRPLLTFDETKELFHQRLSLYTDGKHSTNNTIMHYLANRVSVLEELFLLDKSYDISEMLFMQNSNGQIPLQIVVEAQNIRSVEVLLEAMAQNLESFLSVMERLGKEITDYFMEHASKQMCLEWLSIVASVSQKYGINSDPAGLNVIHKRLLRTQNFSIYVEDRKVLRNCVFSESREIGAEEDNKHSRQCCALM